jgi:hypothetical protein
MRDLVFCVARRKDGDRAEGSGRSLIPDGMEWSVMRTGLMVPAVTASNVVFAPWPRPILPIIPA